jgi:hypothetical protein
MISFFARAASSSCVLIRFERKSRVLFFEISFATFRHKRTNKCIWEKINRSRINAAAPEELENLIILSFV